MFGPPCCYSIVSFRTCSYATATILMTTKMFNKTLQMCTLCTAASRSQHDTTFTLMRFKPRFYQYFCRGRRLRLSCGRLRKVYVLIAVNAVPSRSSRHNICGFLRFYALVEPRLEPHKCERGISGAFRQHRERTTSGRKPETIKAYLQM